MSLYVPTVLQFFDLAFAEAGRLGVASVWLFDLGWQNSSSGRNMDQSHCSWDPSLSLLIIKCFFSSFDTISLFFNKSIFTCYTMPCVCSLSPCLNINLTKEGIVVFCFKCLTYNRCMQGLKIFLDDQMDEIFLWSNRHRWVDISVSFSLLFSSEIICFSDFH